jgi:hypothetical protein
VHCHCPKLVYIATLKDSIFFLIVKNIDFDGKKYPPTTCLSGYLNIAILYSGFLVSQRYKDQENDSPEYIYIRYIKAVGK